MRTFLIGVCIAVVLTLGALAVYWQTGFTVAERYSPHQWVRVSDNASTTARGAGYGTPAETEQREASR